MVEYRKKIIGLLKQFKSPTPAYIITKGKRVVTNPITKNTADKLLRHYKKKKQK